MTVGNEPVKWATESESVPFVRTEKVVGIMCMGTRALFDPVEKVLQSRFIPSLIHISTGYPQVIHRFIHIKQLSTGYPQASVDNFIHSLIPKPVDSPVRSSNLWTYLWICPWLSTGIALIPVDNYSGTVDNPTLDTHLHFSTALSTAHNS